MKTRPQKIRKTTVLLTVLLLLTGFAVADDDTHVSLDNENIQDGSHIWLSSDKFENEDEISDVTLNIEANCPDTSTERTLTLTTPDDEINENTEEESISIELENEYGFGVYNLELDCEDTTSKLDFIIDDIDASFLRYDPEEVHNSNSLSVFLDIQTETSVDISESNFDFTEAIIFPDNEELNDKEVRTLSNDELELRGEVPRSELVSSGDKNLGLEVLFEHENTEISLEPNAHGFRVEDPWVIEIREGLLEENQVDYSEISNGSLGTVYLEFEGEPYEASQTDFYVDIEGSSNTGSVRGFSTGNEGEYEIEFTTVPDLEIGEYPVEIGLEDQEVVITRFNVLNFLSFQGQIKDYHGDGVDSEIDIYSDSETWNRLHGGRLGIDAIDGFYEERILPGTYDMSIDFEDTFQLETHGVNVGTRGDRRIAYDTIPRTELEENQIEGVRVIRGLGVLFSYDVNDAYGTIQYGYGDVDTSEAQILRCENYVFDRECDSWETVPRGNVSFDPPEASVTFPIEPRTNPDSDQNYIMDAFVLAETTSLVPEIEVSTDRTPIGETFYVEGTITDGSDNEVSDANIEVELREGERLVKEVEAITDSSGEFRTAIEAPDRPEETGYYDIRVSGEREPYNGFSMEENNIIEVYVDRDITVDGPDQIELPVGYEVEQEFTITNTGQEELEDISFWISEIDNNFYDASEDSWDSLDAGESASTTVTFEIPEGYFDEDEEPLENHNFNIEVTASSSEGQEQDLFTGVATITDDVSGSRTVEEEQETDGSRSLDASSVSGPTGEFLAAQSSLNIALGLIMIFTLILATAIKKKKNTDDDNGRRDVGGNNNLLSSSGTAKTQKPRGEMRKDKPNITAKTEDKNSNVEQNSQSSEPNKDNQEESSKEDKAQQPEKDNSSDNEQDDSSNEEDADDFTCDVCGEEFDTESAKDLHKQALH